jgi:AraC family transcriptional regulator
MKTHIKNMVCNRCIMAVTDVFKEEGYIPESVSLGEVDTKEEIPSGDMENISHKLQDLGFEIIDDSKGQLIEKIKNIIIELVHYGKDDEHFNYSTLIESELHKDYNYLSNLFSSVEGTTIEKYIINQKIEKVKELLVYGELTLSEIAFRMGYSSVAHLSSQFKKVTGLTPSHFKQLGDHKRKPLDEV